MTDPEIENALQQLGQATQPGDSMRSEVMRRIAELPTPKMGSDTGSASRRIYRIAALALATAACMAALLFVLHSNAELKPRPLLVVVPQTHPSAFSHADAFPRLADYQRAYAQSPEAFERLLQQPTSGASHAAERQLSVGDAVHLDSKLYQ